MTETWAGLLAEVSRELDLADHYGNDANAVKLRRLASLLEQITPETIQALERVIDYPDLAEGYEWQSARLTIGLLGKFSTTPTEETEDR